MGSRWRTPADDFSHFPSPAPAGRGGTSIVVRRFLDAVRGEVVHAPANEWHTESVLAEERYCLRCCGVRWHDVVVAWSQTGKPIDVSWCRVCGEEVRR